MPAPPRVEASGASPARRNRLVRRHVLAARSGARKARPNAALTAPADGGRGVRTAAMANFRLGIREHVFGGLLIRSVRCEVQRTERAGH